MARPTSVAEFQQAQRGETDTAADPGPHEYDVDPDGSIRDWRRPDTTPDRGDVTRSVVNDAAAEPDAYGVPTDAQFNGRLYRDAPDLANIAELLIGEHGHLSGLMNCDIRYYWRRKTGVSKGRVVIGQCKRASDLLGHLSGADFIVWLSATTARDGGFTRRQVEAAVFHQLCHIETDEDGNFISARHDFEGFAAEVRHYGTWTEDLKLGGSAFSAARQMGLFDAGAAADPDGDSPEDASGFGASNEAQNEDILADPAVI